MVCNHSGTEPYPKPFSSPGYFKSKLTLSFSPPFTTDSSSKFPSFLVEAESCLLQPTLCNSVLRKSMANTITFPSQFLQYKMTLIL